VCTAEKKHGFKNVWDLGFGSFQTLMRSRVQSSSPFADSSFDAQEIP
jgi:hypothetical protein